MRRALVGALCGNERKRTRSSRSLGKMPAWAEIVFFAADDVLFFKFFIKSLRFLFFCFLFYDIIFVMFFFHGGFFYGNFV